MRHRSDSAGNEILSRARLAGVHPQVRDAANFALDIADYYGVPVTLTSGRRTYAEQDALYRRYLAGGSRFPAAPPGTSAHEKGMAFDAWTPDEYLDAWDWIRQYVGFQTHRGDSVHAVVPNWRDYV